MTVAASLDTAVGPFAGDGVTTLFSFPWPSTEAGEVAAWVQDDATLVVTLLVEGGDYTIDRVNQLLTLGSPLATGTTMIIESSYQQEQDLDFPSQGRFFPETHERGYDNAVLLIKQLTQKLERISNLENSSPFGTFNSTQAGVQDLIIGGQDYLALILDAVSAVVAPYHIGFSFSDEIASGENVGSWVCPLNFQVDFPQGIANTGAYAVIAPASAAEFEVQLNGARVGGVKFLAGSNLATLIVDNPNFTVTANDRLAIISPSPADPNLDDVSITLYGNRIPWLS